MKFIFIDTETTGVDPKLNAIHQLSAIVEIDGVVVDIFDVKLRPFEGAVIEPDALIVGGVTYQDIMNYPPQEVGYGEFMALLTKHIQQFNKTDKAYFIGYNVKFDNDFVRELFLRNGNKYFGSFFWSNPIDVMTTTTLKLFAERVSMENFQLKTVAKTFGIVLNEEKLHNSMYDIELTRDLFYRSMNLEASKLEIEKTMELSYSDESTIINFGKYRDKKVGDILKVDAQYLRWLHTKKIQNVQFSGELLEQIIKFADIEDSKFESKKGKSGSLAPLDMAPPDQYPDDLPF